MEENLKYETALERLEEIVSIMENTETPLEEMLDLYKESIKLALFCENILDNIEGEVFLLQKNNKDLFEKINFIKDDDIYE